MYLMNTATNTASLVNPLLCNFVRARDMVRDGEARNLSTSTMNKRYRTFFAAEDALKASGAWL